MISPWLFACGCAVALASNVLGHDLHLSTAEAEWNAETRRVEVSLVVFADDLELALMRQSERLMSFEKTEAVALNAEILRYLERTFALKDESGRPAKIEWVGREMGKGADMTVTLFFQLPASTIPESGTLLNAVLCDLFADQLNLLHLKSGAEKRQMRFTREAPSASLVRPPNPHRS